jgi:hypothetical protein
MNCNFLLNTLTLITMLFLAMISKDSIAQYTSLIDSSQTSWNMSTYHSPFDDHEYLTDSLSYVSDTIINGELYREINYYVIDGNGSILWGGEFGYIREDTTTGQAWYRHPYNQTITDFMFYDLSLNVGDSFYIDGSYGGRFPVDSVYYLNGRKHVQVNYVYSEAWIGRPSFFTAGPHSLEEKLTFVEGVGTYFGFFYGDNSSIPGGNDYVLLCQRKANQLVYEQNYNGNFYTDCNTNFIVSTSVKNEIENVDVVSFYPNPMRKRTAYIDVGEGKNGNLHIYTINGVYLGIKELHKGMNHLNFSEMIQSAGVYIYQIKVDGELITRGKLIVLE